MKHPAHINSLGGQQAEGHLRSRRHYMEPERGNWFAAPVAVARVGTARLSFDGWRHVMKPGPLWPGRATERTDDLPNAPTFNAASFPMRED